MTTLDLDTASWDQLRAECASLQYRLDYIRDQLGIAFAQLDECIKQNASFFPYRDNIIRAHARVSLAHANAKETP